MIARLVGEGFEKPEGEATLPVDINYAKVVEWVVDRKVVSSDWKKKWDVLQNKMEGEMKELPQSVARTIEDVPSKDNGKNYWVAKDVLEKLSGTAERGMMGNLKGTAGAWEKIVKGYESGFIQVAEGGMILSRNVDFEIPFLKKQATKNRQTIEDLERKYHDLKKSAASSAQLFEESCQEHGVDPKIVGNCAALDAALLTSAAEFPAKIEKIVNRLHNSNLMICVDYYEKVSKGRSNVLPTLREVIKMSTNKPSTEMTESWIESALLTNNVTDIITGVDDGGLKVDGETMGISWDGLDLDIADAEGDCGDSEPVAVDISWDIDVSGAGEDDDKIAKSQVNREFQNSNADVPVNEANTSILMSLHSRSEPAQKVCVDTDYRQNLINDVLELKAFLHQRSKNTQRQSGEDLDTAKIQDFLSILSSIASEIMDPQMTHLLSTITQKAYRDRLAKKIVQLAGKESKQLQLAEEVELKRQEVQRALISDAAKLSAFKTQTQQIKSDVEAALGAKVGRRINIQGSIYNALQ